jgi:hypothetical protein
MAGPTILVKFLGDMSGLGGAISNVGASAQGVASKMHQTFSSALGALNATGVLGPFGGVLSGIDQSLQTISQHGKDVGLSMLGVGGAVAGIGAGLSVLGSKEQAAHQQLQAAIEATGHSYDQYADQVDKAVTHNERFGQSSAATQDALRTLTTATNDPARALQLLSTATDLAAAKHESLQTASTQLGMALNGSTRIFKQYGIEVDKTTGSAAALSSATKAHESAVNAQTTAQRQLQEAQAAYDAQSTHSVVSTMKLEDAHNKVTAAAAKVASTTATLSQVQSDMRNHVNGSAQAVDELGKKLAGQASAGADTFSGKIKALSTHIEDQVAQFGAHYGPAVTAAGTAMAGMGAAVSTASTLMNAAKAAALGTRIELAAMSVATKVATAAQWLFNAAVDANPIALIVLAIVGLIAVIVLLATKTQFFQSLWSAFTGFMVAAFNLVQTAALAVFHWIEQNWPLLVGILFGPFGLAVAIIVTHFNTIMSMARTVVSTIASVFSTVYNIITAPFRSAATGVSNAISDMLVLVRNIPSEILHALGDVGSLLEHAGEEIIKGLGRGIENAMKSVENTVGGIAGKIASLKGPLSYDYQLLQPAGNAIMGGLHDSLSAGLPDLGRLMGTITSAVTINPNVPTAASGPAVHIENVNLGEAVDVDSFSNRLTWKLQTAGI